MAKVTNLRQFRKRKLRERDDDKAAENRVKFGRTPAERERDQTAQTRAQHKLDQLRRDKEHADDE